MANAGECLTQAISWTILSQFSNLLNQKYTNPIFTKQILLFSDLKGY